MLTAISAIFIFLVVILIHELGHFLVAKYNNIKVNEFSIGMGPKLLQNNKGETTYSLRLIPLGGYVSMEGEDEDSDDPRSFNNAKVGSKLAVISAGAIMNFILAIIVLSIATYGIGIPTTEIESIIDDSPAFLSELKEGDNIKGINGIEINSWNEVVQSISNSGTDENILLEIERDGTIQEISIQPIKEDGRSIVGIVPAKNKSFLGSIKLGFIQTFTMLKAMFQFLGMILTGNTQSLALSGPVGVIQQIGNAAKLGVYDVLMLLGFISINLGFFNLLPIPALDGGRIFFLLIEAIRGKKMDPNKEGFVHFIGFVLLISLMLIVTYKDIIRIIF